MKTTLRLHLALVRKSHNNADENVEQKRTPTYIAGRNVNESSRYGDPSKSQLHPHVPQLGHPWVFTIGLQVYQSTRHRVTHMSMFTGALYTTGKLWNQLDVKGTDEENVVYMHNGFPSSLKEE